MKSRTPHAEISLEILYPYSINHYSGAFNARNLGNLSEILKSRMKFWKLRAPRVIYTAIGGGSLNQFFYKSLKLLDSLTNPSSLVSCFDAEKEVFNSTRVHAGHARVYRVHQSTGVYESKGE